MTSFHAKSDAIWWVHTQRPPGFRCYIMLLYWAMSIMERLRLRRQCGRDYRCGVFLCTPLL